jgi:hypothetical protein
MEIFEFLYFAIKNGLGVFSKMPVWKRFLVVMALLIALAMIILALIVFSYSYFIKLY